MKAFRFRVTALAIALALGSNTLAKAYADDRAAGQGPPHAVQDGYDQMTAQADLVALAELIILGLALFDGPIPAAGRCLGCTGDVERRSRIGHER
jgi:hypothetical protein